jgi:hypothetical protein
VDFEKAEHSDSSGVFSGDCDDNLFEANQWTSTGLYPFLSKLKPGDSFEINILRSGQVLALSVT